MSEETTPLRSSASSTLDKVAEVRAAADRTKAVVQQNIDIAISNVEETEVLTAKAEQMSEQSNKFYKTSKQARRHFCLQDLKITIVLGLVATVIIAWLIFGD